MTWDLNEPIYARKYVLCVTNNMFQGDNIVDRITFHDDDGDKTIYFDNMTDKQAVRIANLINKEIYVPEKYLP